MADRAQYVRHIESYVDSSSSPTQQDASLDAIVSLLKNDILTIEALVREMDMYLTTTDSVIRARGILLLADLLSCLASKALNKTTISSLIGFFTDRLADWKALRGALVGCLVILRRKSNVGMVTDSEATLVAESYLRNLQVQSLAQHDRKLCFELLQCLLDGYPDALVGLGDDLVYGVCEAIDGEKDPQCLMLTFHIVEVLARLFPDPFGPLESFAGDLFEILGCYFPIHFTHSKGEDAGVKRDELSRALMLAFASTPLFEPFAIPLLLEKLSSSLSSAKVDSLKYLSYCTVKYGSERMEKHAKSIWSSLKEAIYTSLEMESEPFNGMAFHENEIATEALVLLQMVILQNDCLFLSLIVGDEDINTTLNSISSFKCYEDITMQNKQKLGAVGRILSVSAQASNGSCNKVFESVFLRLMDALGPSEKICFGALYLCIELLGACRNLVVGSEELTPITISTHETWCCMLQSFCSPLAMAFSSTLVISIDESTHKAYILSGAKGLQILATFPGTFLPVTKSIFEDILTKFISIITLDFNKTFLWKLSLRVLVEVASFIDKHQESEKALSFNCVVVEKLVSLMSPADFTVPLSLTLEAISEIGATGMTFMLRIVHGLEKAIFSSFYEVQGNSKSAESTVQLLECYSGTVLPWFNKNGGGEEVPFHFAVNIWAQIKNSMACGSLVSEQELLGATMRAIKLAVGSCSEGSQSTIIQEAFDVLSSTTSLLNVSMSGSTLVALEGLQVNHNLDSLAYGDEWILSLFASVIIALRPETHIPNLKVIMHLFATTLLVGNAPSAQALGSIVNKLPLRTNAVERSNIYSLEEAIDIIINGSPFRNCLGMGDSSELGLSSLRLGSGNNRLLQIHAIVGLAWLGKGLLMRGHEKVKDMTMTFLSCILSNGNTEALPLKSGPFKDSCEQDKLHLMKSAANSFNILMSDSEDCLNRRFHAIIRPLYKQRYFSTVMPIFLSSVQISDLSITRSMLYRAFAHVISNTPISAIVSEAKKLMPILFDSLSVLSKDILDKDVIYSILLVSSGILTDKNGQEAVVDNVHSIINCLIGLISYPHMMLVRETAIQCLVAMSELPHTRIYPMRTQVLRAISKALDDPKRNVRQEAVRCQQAWAQIASRSSHF